MLIAVVRHRLVFLVGVLLTAVVLGALQQLEIRAVSLVSLPLSGILLVSLLVAGLLAVNARHPKTFVVREGAFTTPPSALAVTTAAMGTVLFVAIVQTGADRGFTAWAINVYAARPDWRPTIGTDDGLLHLETP